MELGGNAPVIVFDDADLDVAVKGTVSINVFLILFCHILISAYQLFFLILLLFVTHWLVFSHLECLSSFLQILLILNFVALAYCLPVHIIFYVRLVRLAIFVV